MKNSSITTIKIHKETKERLDKLKENPRETYEEILKKILFILNTIKSDPQKARNLINRVDISRKQYTEVYLKKKEK